MSTFIVQPATAGNAMLTMPPRATAVEIAIRPTLLREHDRAYVLSKPLKTEQEIKDEIGRLIRELEQLRDTAIQSLKEL